MAKLYGHNHLIALRGEQGHLCYRWFASDNIGILTFTSPKLANEWLKQAGKLATMPKLSPVPVSELPEGVKIAINPPDEDADIRRMLGRIVYRS